MSTTHPPRAAQPGDPSGVRTRAEPGIDPRRWPDVVRVPRAPLRGRAARALAAYAFAHSPIRVATPGGPVPAAGGPDAPLLELHRPDHFYRRLATAGLIGFGESYMAGDWSAPEPVRLLTVLAEHYGALVPRPLQPLRHVTLPRRSHRHRNTRSGARRNIHHHYDLSNDLFALFLDETMTYSAALFEGAADGGPAELAAAQRRKIDRLLDATRVGEETRVLEIGTGWGELALRAARRGARVTSVTLSPEQRDLARERARRAGVADRTDIRLCDYREVEGRYDAVLSVEMIEAVGERYWPVYFTELDRHTAPGGRVGLQAITMEHTLMRASRGSDTWMHKYIFPGGLIPSVPAIEEQVRRRTGLRIADRRAFGSDYAETLRIWRERFEAAEGEVAALGFDAVFRKMWSFYLAYCEAGFRAGMIDVEQIVMERDRP
ncbi:cyclopropane-fatty-acyl-phospholipid synthase family protein [Streptomonospora wellingtoniae]|uniref:Cyclopropane-fatty-acyl-phospholipid synthase family protein n=1 Tax=Streptomonospora wellingtoniae TaxID=3075544 RepID=A0ABU2KNT0_9ACTN|nr:cyclopropane-fatty-acyl-phospholipid synthase family protein [Streptomonospora sp. DSM 45055]MDT0300920.1 cyclopropane-fatty-acyl-phospholipid synthase family protein [Streptomonospora sp. DSM 45055]